MRDKVEREKVIRGLTCCIDGGAEACLECPYCADLNVDDFGKTEWHCRDLRKDALALLKAQEPVEPIPTADDDWICGMCNNSVVGTTELDASGFVPVRFNYCQNCGRAVKWERVTPWS